MTERELEKKIEQRQALKRMIEQVTAQMTAVEDEIKAEMGETEEMVVGPFKLLFKTVTSSRLDPKLAKAVFSAAALAPCMKTSTTRRFEIR